MAGLRLLPPFRRAPRGAAPTNFLQKWSSAVCDCIGFAWCRHLIGDHGKLIITPQQGMASVEVLSGKGSESLAPIELAPSQRSDVALRSYAENSGKRQVVLRIPQQQAVRRRFSLPAAVAENLERVVPSELDRLTPFSAEQVFFDFTAKPSEHKAGMLDIDLAVILRRSCEPWVARLTELGIKPQVIDIEQAWPGQNLLPQALRPRKKRGAFVLNLFLATLVLALALTALGIPLYQKREVVLALGDAERMAQKRANQVVSLRTAVAESRESSRRVVDKRLSAIPVVEIIAELTRIMPDNTWVQNMDIDAGKIQLRGETSQASSLIGLLETSKLFRDVAFSSPVVQVPRSDKERFHLSAKLERGE